MNINVIVINLNWLIKMKILINQLRCLATQIPWWLNYNTNTNDNTIIPISNPWFTTVYTPSGRLTSITDRVPTTAKVPGRTRNFQQRPSAQSFISKDLRIRSPYLRKENGTGTVNKAMNPSTEFPQPKPRFWYNGGPASGNTIVTAWRKIINAAIAEAL